MSEEQVEHKLVCFRVDGDPISQGIHIGATTQILQNHASYMFGIHCMAHKTNFVVSNLSNMPIVTKIEDLCQHLYAYFAHSPNKLLEFQVLPEILKIEGGRMLCNVKQRWISLLSSMQSVL